MKFRIVFFLVTAFLFTTTCYSQYAYFGFGGGYGNATNKTNSFDDEKINYSASANTYEYISHPNSLGKGINESVYLGYMFGNGIGLELGGSFLQGSDIKTKLEFHDNVTDYHEKRKHTISATMNRIVPCIRITTGKKQLHPYLTAGLILGVAGKISDAVTIETYGSGSNGFGMEAKAEYTKGLSYGFHGSLGVDLKMDEAVGFFLEMFYNYQSWAPGHGKLVAYSENGVDLLGRIPTSVKNVDYKDDYIYNTAISPGYVGLRQSSKFYLPLSSVGATIGIHVLITKKPKFLNKLKSKLSA